MAAAMTPYGSDPAPLLSVPPPAPLPGRGPAYHTSAALPLPHVPVNHTVAVVRILRLPSTASLLSYATPTHSTQLTLCQAHQMPRIMPLVRSFDLATLMLVDKATRTQQQAHWLQRLA